MIDDELVEGVEDFTVSVSTISGPVLIATQYNTTVPILDNDCELHFYFYTTPSLLCTCFDFIHVDYIISWESLSYALSEDDATAMICANGSGTIQDNLNLNVSVVSVDITAEGVCICLGRLCCVGMTL